MHPLLSLTGRLFLAVKGGGRWRSVAMERCAPDAGLSFYGARLLWASGKINTFSKSRCQLPRVPGFTAARRVGDGSAEGRCCAGFVRGWPVQRGGAHADGTSSGRGSCCSPGPEVSRRTRVKAPGASRGLCRLRLVCLWPVGGGEVPGSPRVLEAWKVWLGLGVGVGVVM